MPSSNQHRTPARGRRGGFTLVEILMALAICALLLSGAAVAISVSSQTMEVNQRQSAFSQTARMILGRMTREIRRADAVDVDAGVLRILPPAGGSVTLCEYERDGTTLIYRQSSGGTTESYTLVDPATDGYGVSAFDLREETCDIDGVTCTASINVRLTLNGDGESISLTASARPRRNLPW